MKKILVCILTACCLMGLIGCSNSEKKAERVIGYSALYDENLINEACNVVEREFAKKFKGCTLKEIRYDDEVENRFADEIMEYATDEDKELIVLLSTFDTDKKGGDGSLNSNATYTDWQWRLVRTEDKKSWELVDWGY